MSAAVLGITGVALLFAPAELSRLASDPEGAGATPLFIQLWAAALLGLAAANWIGRGLVLGGIYGRALVMGNLVHWLVAALVGVRAVIDRPSSAPVWAVAGVCGVLALLFSWLLRQDPASRTGT